MRTIGSHPGAGKFRSTAVLILIVICIGLFLSYTKRWEEQLEEVAIDQVVISIKSILAIEFYKIVLKGKQAKLQAYHLENPFIFLAAHQNLPRNYYGVVSSKMDIERKGEWYFDSTEREAIYVYKEKSLRRFFQLVLEYTDVDSNNNFDYLVDTGYFLNLREIERL